MKTLVILLIHFVGLSSSYSTNAQDVQGTWGATIHTGEEPVEVVYQLLTDGENLTGSVFMPNGVFPISEGTVHGNTVSFVIMYGDIRVFHTGYYLREQLLMSTSYQGNSGQLTLNRVAE